MSPLFDFAGIGRPPPAKAWGWANWLRRGADAPGSKPIGFYKGPPTEGSGWFWTPRVVGPNDYPLDLDASERIVRPREGLGLAPTPYLQVTWDGKYVPMQAIATGAPFADLFLSQTRGNNPTGPVAGSEADDAFTQYIYTDAGKLAG